MICEGVEKIISFSATKRHGFSQDFGSAHFGFCLFGLYNRFAGIYQRYTGKVGKPIVRKAFYWPTQVRTVAQQANRAKFTAGAAAWAALTVDQKALYNYRARSKRMLGYHLFQREYMLS